MIPTVGEVYDQARAKLGEHVAGGEAFGNDVLQPHLGTAYRKLIRIMDVYNNRFTQRRLHYVLPARTVAFVPSQVNVDDFGEPIEVREKSPDSTHTVSSVTVADDHCDVVLSGAHGLSQGALVYLYGIQGLRNDRINDEWVVTSVPNTTTVRLGGCVEAGTYTSGGVMVAAEGEWSGEYDSAESAADLRQGHSRYFWSGDAFRFASRDEDRLLRIAYSISGNPPKQESRSLHIDDSLDFLASYLGYLAAKALGADQTAALMLREAVGNDHNEDARGGHLGDLVALGIQTLQATPYIQPRYRPRRNFGRRSRTTLLGR